MEECVHYQINLKVIRLTINVLYEAHRHKMQYNFNKIEIFYYIYKYLMQYTYYIGVAIASRTLHTIIILLIILL